MTVHTVMDWDMSSTYWPLQTAVVVFPSPTSLETALCVHLGLAAGETRHLLW